MRVAKARMLLGGVLLVSLLGSTTIAVAEQDVVRWETLVGNIRTGAAGAVGSGTGAVNAAGAPWVAIGGRARVNLESGQLRFRVRGLVLADGNAVGTPGNNPEVRGTLVCDTDGSAGGGNSVLVLTPLVPLSLQGDAEFTGEVGPLPAECLSEPDIAFLVRSVAGLYFAAGIVRTP
jgi:hypothetical protein